MENSTLMKSMAIFFLASNYTIYLHYLLFAQSPKVCKCRPWQLEG